MSTHAVSSYTGFLGMDWIPLWFVEWFIIMYSLVSLTNQFITYIIECEWTLSSYTTGIFLEHVW